MSKMPSKYNGKNHRVKDKDGSQANQDIPNQRILNSQKVSLKFIFSNWQMLMNRRITNNSMKR